MKFIAILLMSCLFLQGCGGTTSTVDSVSVNSVEESVDEIVKININDLLMNPVKYEGIEFETVMVVDMTKEINGIKSLYSEHHIYNRVVFETDDADILIGDIVQIRGSIGDLESKMVENFESFTIHLKDVEIISKNDGAKELYESLTTEYETKLLDLAKDVDFNTMYSNIADYKVNVAKLTGTIGESSDFGYFAFVDEGIIASTYILPDDIGIGDTVTIYANAISVSEQLDGVLILQVDTLKIDKN